MNHFSRRAGYMRTRFIDSVKNEFDEKYIPLSCNNPDDFIFGNLWAVFFMDILKDFSYNFENFFGKDIDYRIVLRAFNKEDEITHNNPQILKDSFVPIYWEPLDNKRGSKNRPITGFIWANKEDKDCLIKYAYEKKQTMIYSIKELCKNNLQL